MPVNERKKMPCCGGGTIIKKKGPGTGSSRVRSTGPSPNLVSAASISGWSPHTALLRILLGTEGGGGSGGGDTTTIN